MPLKFVEFSKAGSCINIERGALVVTREEAKKRIPLDTISGIMFTGYGQMLSSNIISKLTEQKTVIIFTNRKFEPISMILPLMGHKRFIENLDLQVSMSVVLKKNIWKKIIKQKIKNQGSVLTTLNGNDEDLFLLSKNVYSGDKRNVEARAAKIYWKKVFQHKHIRGDKERNLNILLNYSYTVLRAIVARQVYKSGLWPMFGVKHCNKSNVFPLVDDLIEVFRPIMDLFISVYEKESSFEVELNKEFKFLLAGFLNLSIPLKVGKSSLEYLIEVYIYSYLESMKFKDNKLLKDFEINWNIYVEWIQDHVVTSNF